MGKGGSENCALESDGPLAILSFSNPPLNLFTSTLTKALRDAVREVAVSDFRALLIRAAGEVVSGGADVREFASLTGPAAAEHFRQRYELIHAVEDLPIPSVFAAHALCLTAAFELSLACDVLLASDSARFGLVERIIGLTPSAGGTQRLVDRAGPARALHLIYSGAVVDAGTLERWNVVSAVLPDTEFGADAHQYALNLANGPTQAHIATKRITRIARTHGVRAADEAAAQVSADLFETEDVRTGLNSFFTDGPGKARFSGR